MKHGFLLLLILGFQTLCSGQSLLQEAIALKPFFKFDVNKKLVLTEDTVSNEAKVIIKRYLVEGVKLDPFNVKAAFKDNPYLDMEKAAQNMGAISGGNFSGLGANQGASPSGFSVTNLADGLARFLVKRTKQELSMAFFEGFKEKIKDNAYLEHFCPYTRSELLLIDSDVYQFNDYLESLREGFTADMSALPGSTESFMRDPSLCPNCQAKPAGKVVTDFLHIAQQMVNGEPPVDMIAYLAEPGSAIQSAPTTEPQLYNMASGLRFLNIISESFRNPASDNKRMPWYTASEIREEFKDPIVIRIYLGLLWQRVDKIQFTDDSGTQFALMRNLMSKANTGANLVETWRNSIQSLSEMTQAIQFGLNSSASTTSTVVDDFFSYSQSVTDLLQAVNQTGRTILDRQKDLIPIDYILLMRQCNSLYFNVRQRNFVGAVSNVIYCLSMLGGDKDNIATMLKYANFMAAIAEASSPEDMERAIESFALPPGSSQMKKQPGRFAVALNAYTGLAGGYEYLNSEKTPKPFGAITAPLGLSMSWGLGNHVKRDKPDSNAPNKEKDSKNKVYSWGSLGFFVPLIDVGAVTAYRFKDSTAQDLPELTWGNILSPGLYVVYDLPGKIPVAVGYGAQIGPSLRQITTSGGPVNKSGWRHGLFATVDIPITYFYLGKGKPKKTKT